MDMKITSAAADQTFTELLQILSSINDNDINTVPFPGSWTAAQLAQHIILSTGSFVQLLNGTVTGTTRNPEAYIPNLKAIFLDFNSRMKSPDFIVPEEKDYNKQRLIQAIQTTKIGLLEAIATLDLTKTCTGFELPGSGYITRAEAITFSIVHTQRHINQLKNIRQKLYF